MKDILQDIVSHTHNLGFISTVKITGDDKATKIDSIAEDRSVVLYGETNQPQPLLAGVFGMSLLNKLKILLECDEYKENAKLEILTRSEDGQDVPAGIHFENQSGDFCNDYRFMSTSVINEKLKTTKFRGANWDVEFSPTLQSIQRFNFQATANTEHSTFLVKTENGNLKFIFGDVSTHGGEFVFATGVKGKLTKPHTWPVAAILSILKIADVNKCTIKISDLGALEITMDSGLATYRYIIPAQA